MAQKTIIELRLLKEKDQLRFKPKNKKWFKYLKPGDSKFEKNWFCYA